MLGINERRILDGLVPEPASLSAWAGVCSGNHESAGKRYCGLARPSNTTLRATLAEFAHGAARTKDRQFHGFHSAMTARIAYKRAILATAHKLLRTTYVVVRDDHNPKAPQVKHQNLLARCNVPRWARTMEAHGLFRELLDDA